jgi:hypothetical protein
MNHRFCLFLLLIPFLCQAQWKGQPVDFTHGNIMVSGNKRFLQHTDGTPFFWLGDTGWELFHRLDREEADHYLTDRAQKGFTVIQAVAIAELDGLNIPNACGHLPFENLNPDQPSVKGGEGDDYWDHVDYIVGKANDLGMYIGFLPTWGRYWQDDRSTFTPENAYRYGLFLGKRYKERKVIWILGGDRTIKDDRQRSIITSMAHGLREGDGGKHLITFHPTGGRSSSEYFHDAPWLDFNMRQNGHSAEYTDRYSQTSADYNRTPVKPVIDGEPLYEDHPLSFNPSRLGHSLAADIRKTFYWDIFDGAFGHTYGHHSVWQMYDPEKKRNPINNPLMSWKEALDQPGASQMIYGRLLMESRPFLTRIPDSSVIVRSNVPTSVPGEGRYRFVATRDEAGTYAMVYVPAGREFAVRTNVIKGKRIKAWWFNPRNGKATLIKTFTNTGNIQTFVPPDKGEQTDWILVLDDAACKYPAPGSKPCF